MQTLLNPAAVARLSNLQLKAHAVVEGFLTGLHQSPYHGFSVEFAQHRPYMPGDSLKHLDYKVLGKTGRYYIKQFEEETNLKAYILVDHSGSMGFGSKLLESGLKVRSKSDQTPPSNDSGFTGVHRDAHTANFSQQTPISKLDYSTCLAAAISLLLLKQRDAVGLVTFAESLSSILPPKSTMGWLGPLTTQLQSLQPLGKTKVASALFDVAERVKRRGLVVLISDLLDNPEETLAAMKAVRHVGHELLVFHVLDPLEVTFDFPRDAKFKDLETAELLPTRPHHIRQAYREEMGKVLEYYKHGCSGGRIDYRLFTTDVPYEVALFEFLARRKRMK